jgi:hypothetical protein
LCDIADRPITDDATPTTATDLIPKNLTDHCCDQIAIGSDHQHIPWLEQIEGIQHGPKVGRFALRCHSAAKEARLLARWAQRTNGWVDLTSSVADIYGDRDWDRTPAFDLG